MDRHHLTKALWQSGVKQVRVKVIARLQDKENFWSQMQCNHWAWLKDEKGGALTPQQLPAHIGELPDYPYRTVAGLLQDAGYFDKREQVYFVEFAWASWLGQQMDWLPVDSANLADRLYQAKRLACSSKAADLPGYPGKQCRVNCRAAATERIVAAKQLRGLCPRFVMMAAGPAASARRPVPAGPLRLAGSAAARPAPGHPAIPTRPAPASGRSPPQQSAS